MFYKLSAGFFADEERIGIFLFQFGFLRTGADNDFTSRPIHFEEVFDVFFNGDASDIQGDRTFEIMKKCFFSWSECIETSAARDAVHRVLKAPVFQRFFKASGGDGHAGRGGMETTDVIHDAGMDEIV